MADPIEGYVSEAHYECHVGPILAALPSERRGKLFAPDSTARELHAQGIACEVGYGEARSSAPLLTAAFQDLRYGHRPHILQNHGSAQEYVGLSSGSYAGGPFRECDLSLHPSERAAALDRERYGTPAIAVGCPKLDQWLEIPKPANAPPVVAFTFHWPQHVRDEAGQPIPEAGTAWPEWRTTIETLVASGAVRMFGHAHPRDAREKAVWWQSLGVEFVPRLEDVVRRADVLVLDNSSVGAEWSALDRPTVWLDGAGWRDVHGPPRFDGDLPGPRLSAPVGVDANYAAEGLALLCSEADKPYWRERRAAFVARVYDGLVDGHASERAADAVLSRWP